MTEAEVIQNRPFIRYGHFRTEWTSQKDIIYRRQPNCTILIIREKSWKNQLSYMKMHNICST